MTELNVQCHTISMRMRIFNAQNAFKSTKIYANGVQEGGTTHRQLDYSYFQ